MGANDSKSRPDGDRNDLVKTMPYFAKTSENCTPSLNSQCRGQTRVSYTTQIARGTTTTAPAVPQQKYTVPTYIATKAPVTTTSTALPSQRKPKLPLYGAPSAPSERTSAVVQQKRIVSTHAVIDPPAQTAADAAAAQQKRTVPTYVATNPPPPTTEAAASFPQDRKAPTSSAFKTPSAAAVDPQKKRVVPNIGATDTTAQEPQKQSYQTHYQPNTRQSHAYYTIATPHGPQTTNKPRQQQQQQQQQPRSNAGFTQPQRPAAANSPSGAVHTQNRQTLQQPRQQTPRQTPNQSARQSSQGQPQQNTKPKKQSLSEVVQSLKQILEGYDGHRFTLEGIDALYRVMKGESIPYTAHGFPSLSSFIESKCDFLTIFTGADGTTQILLRPPSYQEAVNHPMSSTSVAANLQVKHNVSALVHDEISLTDFNRLKIISETKARNGITIQEFENLYFAEFQTRIDFKGFSRAAFFHGLDDIVETREDRDGIKLYTKSGCQNAPKTPQKSSAPQTAANKSQHNAGNKGQPSPGKKNHHSGGQKPQNGNNNRHPSKQHEQHQPRAQQSQNRSHSRQRDAKPKVELTPFYEKELRKMLQQCRAPGGVTPKAFKQYFREHSSLHFCTYDVSDEEFFSALPHIFQINRGPNGIRLMPTPLSTGLARNNFSNWQSTSVLEGTPTRASREKVSASVGNLSAACSMHMLMGGRCLWIVSIENYEYVPTGCVAKLANMAKDTVINDLRKHSLEIRYIKKLEDQDIKKVLVNNNVARADEVVMTIPLKSVPIILRAFLGRDVDDAFMANLEEVSKEHVRNKRFGRPNRQ